jgi:hypothetical protein
MGKTFSRVWKFSDIILLNILHIPLAYTKGEGAERVVAKENNGP